MTLPKSLTTVTAFSKITAVFIFILLPLIGFLVGMEYYNMTQKDYAGDSRLRIFSTQEECESFVGRKCLPTVCEANPTHISCKANNQKGWFATRQPIGSEPTISPAPDNIEGWKMYIDQNISFKYPATWEILSETPKEYTLENGGMFQRNCSFFIQDTNNKTTVIAIEILEKGVSGDYCWSRGYFYDYTDRTIKALTPPPTIQVGKWQEDKNQTKQWSGVYFQKYQNIALVTKKESKLEAEKIFDQILSTFEFVEERSNE